MPTTEEKIAKRSLKTSYVSTIVSITLVLYVMGFLAFVVLNAKKISDYVRENIGFTIFFQEDVPEAEVLSYQKTLNTQPYVKSSEYFSKDKAAESFQKDLGEDFVSFIGYNPLPSTIEVKLKADYATNQNIEKIKMDLSKNKLIKEITYQKALAEQVNSNVKKISLFILGIGCLLLIIAYALINNTIRLSVYSKRFLLKSMLLVGATQRFIRRPFIIAGLIQGFIGSLLSVGLMSVTIYFSTKQIPELANLQDTKMFIILYGFIVALGLLISLVSTFFAVSKYLKMKTDFLYYH